MAYVDSTSTLAEVEAAYEDAATYDVIENVTTCKEFIVAARILSRRIAQEVEQGDSKVRENVEAIGAEIKKAESWLDAHDSSASSISGGAVKYFDISSGMRS